ncbi:hypothetical protein D3C87_1845520 [compost metagenome]
MRGGEFVQLQAIERQHFGALVLPARFGREAQSGVVGGDLTLPSTFYNLRCTDDNVCCRERRRVGGVDSRQEIFD